MNCKSEKNQNALYLKDLCIYILRKWRILIITMLAGAVLLGAYKGIIKTDFVVLSDKAAKSIQDQIDQNNESIANYNLTILENNNKITLNKKKIAADQTDLEVQNALVTNLEEIISKYKNAGASAVESLVIANAQLSNIRQKISSDEIEITDLQQQNDYITKVNESLQPKIDKLNKANETLLQSLKPQPGSNISIGTIIEYGFLGAVLGALIICVISIIKYMTYKKLHNANELWDNYNIRIIGTVYDNDKLNKHNGIDKLLDKWSGYNKTTDISEQYKRISSAIQFMSPEGSKEIVLTGTTKPELINQIMDKLKEYIPQDGRPLYAVANPVYDIDALLKIKAAAVVLIEETDTSEKREIEKLISILNAGKTEIVGAVVL